jgi:hypothetical protein
MTTTVAFLIGLLAAGAATKGAPAPGDRPEVCELLDAGDIEAVQGAKLADRKASAQQGKDLRFEHCYFATSDAARSTSLTLISGNRITAREFWNDTFRAPVARAGKKDPPRAISGTGGEAFWTGDARAGALYVLAGDAVLRISVGGVQDEEERIRRSKALALAALARLRQDSEF